MEEVRFLNTMREIDRELYNIQQVISELWALADEISDSLNTDKSTRLFQLLNELEERVKYVEKLIFY